MSRAGLWLLVLVLVAPCAAADWQLRSWSRWEITPDSVEAVLGIERIELQRLSVPDDPAWLAGEVARSMQFGTGTASCVLTATEPQASLPALLMLRMRFDCPGEVKSPRIRVRLLLDRTPQPLHYAAIRYNGHASEALLTRDNDTVMPREVTAAPEVPAVLRTYTALGFIHILEGLDHIAFLLCLLLAAKGFGRRAWMVTGFTAGHSITLSLSALGLVRVQTAGVEALIGFTVALLAAEVWQRVNGRPTATVLLVSVCICLLMVALAGTHDRLPTGAAVALLVLALAYLRLASHSRRIHALHLGMMAVFGLVHGLGFASALRSIGLPDGQRGWALAGFNLGVEIGQLLLLLAFAGGMAFVARFAGATSTDRLYGALSALLFGTGVFWLVERAV